MFIPIKTDAPVYHWPFATLGLIVANVLVFAGQISGDVSTPDFLLLYGEGLHPVQWITSNFLHSGPIHLLGNMLFLWVFGLVVEGKVGWWRFLLIYIGIAVLQSAGEQIIMLSYAGDVPGSLGASAAIFGLLGIAAVWAPENDVSLAIFIFFFRVLVFEVNLLIYGGFLLAWELAQVIFLGAGGASSMLHISGAILGVVVGVAMVKWNLVDCEGWDAFSRWNWGINLDRKAKEQKRQRATEPTTEDAPHSPAPERLAAAREQLNAYLKRDNPQAVLVLLDKLSQTGVSLELTAHEMLTLIQALHRQQLWHESAPWMGRYLELEPDDSLRVRLKLAQICIAELNRPARAQELLSAIDPQSLPANLLKVYSKLQRASERQLAAGELELDDGAW